MVLRQHPHTQPNKTKKSATPRFHGASKAIRDGLREAYCLFLGAFSDAAELLKAKPLGEIPGELVPTRPPICKSPAAIERAPQPDPQLDPDDVLHERTREDSVLASLSRPEEENFRTSSRRVERGLTPIEALRGGTTDQSVKGFIRSQKPQTAGIGSHRKEEN